MALFDALDLFVAVAIGYGIFIAIFLYFRSLKQKRRSVALNYIRRWNEQDLRSAFSKLVSDARSEKVDLEELLYRWSTDAHEPSRVTEMLRVWDFFEEMSLAVIFGEADEELAKQFFFYSLITTYRISERPIGFFRDRYRSAGLYRNLERLYGKWSSDKKFVLVREVAR